MDNVLVAKTRTFQIKGAKVYSGTTMVKNSNMLPQVGRGRHSSKPRYVKDFGAEDDYFQNDD